MSSILGTYARKNISFTKGKGSYLYAENGLVPWFLIFYVADTFDFSFTRYERKQFSFVCLLNI